MRELQTKQDRAHRISVLQDQLAEVDAKYEPLRRQHESLVATIQQVQREPCIGDMVLVAERCERGCCEVCRYHGILVGTSGSSFVVQRNDTTEAHVDPEYVTPCR